MLENLFFIQENIRTIHENVLAKKQIIWSFKQIEFPIRVNVEIRRIGGNSSV